MKRFFRYIYVLLTALGILSTLTSCIFDKYTDPAYDWGDSDGKVRISLRISPLDATSNNVNVTERIKSLRIIMLSDGYVEVNQKIDYSSNPISSSTFRYIFTTTTMEGNKRFYLIANEESVPEVMFNSTVTLPEGLSSNPSLSALLDSFIPDEIEEDGPEDGANEGTAQQFENVMRVAYMAPQYEITSDNSVYLPYTAYYSGFTVEKDDDDNYLPSNYIEQPMYLVPDAVKFEFHFTNYRNLPVSISRISLTNANNQNFIFAQVGSNDINKTLPNDNTQYYWVDWLAQIAELSQNYPDSYPNQSFNETYGWITDYSMPNSSTLAVKTFFSDASSPASVDGIDEDGVPGNLFFGPYYIPESRNLVTFTDANGFQTQSQTYYLSIGLGSESEDTPTFENITIPNLQALFRNTHVTITLEMNQGDVQIFAEIADWTEKSASGWVVD